MGNTTYIVAVNAVALEMAMMCTPHAAGMCRGVEEASNTVATALKHRASTELAADERAARQTGGKMGIMLMREKRSERKNSGIAIEVLFKNS